jgi:signal transduction histidine kinase
VANEQNLPVTVRVEPLALNTTRLDLGLIAASTGSVLVAATLIGALGDDPVEPIQRGSPMWLTLLCVVTLALLTSAMWVAHRDRPQASFGLALVAAGVLVPLWAAWPSLPDSVRAGAPALALFTIVGSAHVALCWTSRPARSAALGVMYLLAALAAGCHLIGYNPLEDPGCFRLCTEVRPIGHDFVTTHTAVVASSLLAIVDGTIATAAILRTRQKAPVVIRLGAVVATTVLTGAHLARWATWRSVGPSDTSLLLPAVVAAAAVSGAVCIATRRLRRIRIIVDGLVEQLDDPSTAFDQGEHAVLMIHFNVPDDRRWVDADGCDVDDPPRDAGRVILSDTTGPVLRLMLRSGTPTNLDLSTLTPGSRLALRNAQLAAITRARLADIATSQRRLVEVSDRERRRIERDLHDGTQQRLVSAAIYLNIARAGLTHAAAPLDRTALNLHQALSQLRHIGHGIFPHLLETEGLAAALDELVFSCPVPATLQVGDGANDVDTSTAIAIYATAAAALDHLAASAPAQPLRVSLERNDRTCCVFVKSPSPSRPTATLDLTEVGDRVGALGGQLTITSTDEQTKISVELPCAS